MSQDFTPQDLLPSLNKLIRLARKQGASGIELLHTTLVERQFKATGTQKGPLNRNESRILSGKVYMENGANASFSINADLSGRHPASVEKAVIRAQKAKPDPLAGPAERMDIAERGMGLKDPRYERIDDEALNDLIAINQAGPDVPPHRLNYTDRRLQRFFVSSRETYANSVSTFYKLRLSNTIPGTSTPLHILACGRAFSHVGSIPFGRGLESRMTALSMPCATPTGPIPLVLPTRVMAWLLEQLAPAFDVRSMKGKSNFLSGLPDGILGTRAVHIVDDPAMVGGVRTRAFDDQGVPPMAVPIVSEGRVGNAYFSVEAARSEDVRPTGHFWAGKIRHSNLILRSGNRSRTQMLTEVPLAVEIDHLRGELNLKTGHLTASGPALVLEKGKPQGAVRSVEIDMPLQALLCAVKEIASNQLRHGAVDSATVLTEPLDVKITG
jgi:predicted Zn-dependent protease